MEHYGGKCVLCGEADPRLLTIDHVEGGGTKERREKSRNIAHLLYKLGYPAGYRVLCQHCNWLEYLRRRRDG